MMRARNGSSDTAVTMRFESTLVEYSLAHRCGSCTDDCDAATERTQEA